MFPTHIVQGMQVLIQRRVVARVLGRTGQMKPPFPLTLLAHFPFLRRLPALLIGLGVRPEHVRTLAERETRSA